MGETETTKPDADSQEQAGEEETTTSENDSGADESTEEGADTDENNDDDSSDDEEETDDDETDDNEDDKKSKKSTSKDADEDEDKEPPTRKRPSDFIKARQERKKAKDAAKSEKSDDDESDDDIDPADEETIGKVVQKALKPFLDKQVQESDEKEVTDFLKANPDFKPYEAKVRKYMAHPSRKDVPIQEIFYGVAGADLLKLGAKRGKTADNEAKKTKSAGGSADAGGTKSVADMSRDELEAKQNEVRRKLADR